MGRLLQPLSEAQLQRLDEHRYRAEGRSLLEPPLQLYWAWLLGRTPAWLAPNAITLLGLATNLITSLLLVWHCPGARQQLSLVWAPAWLFAWELTLTSCSFAALSASLCSTALTGRPMSPGPCGLARPTFWDYEIPVLGLRMKILPVFGIVAGAIYSCTNYFQVIFTGGTGKNGSTIAGTSVLSPALHIGLVLTMAIMIYKKSTTGLFENHPCLYVLMFGCVASKVTNKLVVAHMTRSKMKLQDTAFIGPGLLFLNQYFNSFINEYFVLWAAMIFSLCDLLTYCTAVCIQIAAHLHIEVFRIPHQAPEQVHNHHD
uniref:cholinephosphotransferase 1 isoform X3 n=1 Tax=Pristiophorus japonicus TaxID=55135 RepID=UPI00398F607F